MSTTVALQIHCLARKTKIPEIWYNLSIYHSGSSHISSTHWFTQKNSNFSVWTSEYLICEKYSLFTSWSVKFHKISREHKVYNTYHLQKKKRKGEKKDIFSGVQRHLCDLALGPLQELLLALGWLVWQLQCWSTPNPGVLLFQTFKRSIGHITTSALTTLEKYKKMLEQKLLTTAPCYLRIIVFIK